MFFEVRGEGVGARFVFRVWCLMFGGGGERDGGGWSSVLGGYEGLVTMGCLYVWCSG